MQNSFRGIDSKECLYSSVLLSLRETNICALRYENSQGCNLQNQPGTQWERICTEKSRFLQKTHRPDIHTRKKRQSENTECRLQQRAGCFLNSHADCKLHKLRRVLETVTSVFCRIHQAEFIDYMVCWNVHTSQINRCLCQVFQPVTWITPSTHPQQGLQQIL